MPPAARNQPEQSGIFSSVFGYFSREVGNFVATATGGNVAEQASQPGPSRSRAHRVHGKRDGGVKKRRRVPRQREEYESDEEDLRLARRARERARSRPLKRAPVPPSPAREPSVDDYTPSPPQAGMPLPRSPSPAREESEPEHERTPSASPSRSPSPPPLPRQLRRRPSFTMPGSLFPRTASLEPDGSQDGEDADGRHVRFAQGVVSPPVRNPSRGRSSTPAEPVAGPSKPRAPRSPSRPRTGSTIENAVRRFDEDADPSLLLPNVQVSPSRTGGRTGDRHRSVKGKEREREVIIVDELDRTTLSVELEPEHGDSSGVIHVKDRMKGMERELSVAREELREKERRWEKEVRTAEVQEERKRDHERIRTLEEENRRLREELALAKRSAVISSGQRQSAQPLAPPMAPPPAPTPPPMPSATQRIPTAAETSALFANVRAHLKHTAPPVEAPINAAVYGAGARTKRTGQPTVNVPSDKMAAFLTEMKTVKLRKVNSRPDMSETQPVASGSGLSRSTSTREAPQIMRRRLTDGAANPPSRCAMDLADKLSQSFSGRTISSQPMAGPSSSVAPQVQTWPSVSVDGTDATPSLTDDNDPDTSSGDRLSSPSPVFPAPEPLGPFAFDKLKGKEKATHPVDDVPAPTSRRPRRPASPPARIPSKEPASRHPPESLQPKQSVFDKRPPTSPMPSRTPRKPRPPARVPSKDLRRAPERADDSDDDDPLRLSYDAPSSPVMRPADKNKGTAATKKRPRPTSNVPQKPTKGAREPTERSQSHAVGTAKPHHARRRTLDEELRIAEDSLREDELQDIDLEDEILIGTGTRNKGRGFLAHGGAGGAPVFMGVGYVEGAEEDEERPRKRIKSRAAGSGRSKR